MHTRGVEGRVPWFVRLSYGPEMAQFTTGKSVFFFLIFFSRQRIGPNLFIFHYFRFKKKIIEISISVFSITMKLHCNWKKLKTKFSLNIFLLTWFVSTYPLTGYIPHRMVKYEQVKTYSLSQKKIQTNYAFLYCKFPIVLQKHGERPQNSSYKFFFLWILVHMIAIHHCAKEQHAWLDVVQIRPP